MRRPRLAGPRAATRNFAPGRASVVTTGVEQLDSGLIVRHREVVELRVERRAAIRIVSCVVHHVLDRLAEPEDRNLTVAVQRHVVVMAEEGYALAGRGVQHI